MPLRGPISEKTSPTTRCSINRDIFVFLLVGASTTLWLKFFNQFFTSPVSFDLRYSGILAFFRWAVILIFQLGKSFNFSNFYSHSLIYCGKQIYFCVL